MTAATAGNSGSETVGRAVCPHDCPDTCSLLVTLDGDRPVAVRGNPEPPFTQGFLCHKVSRYAERHLHPDRLQHPMLRNGAKGAGDWRRTDWDTALDQIVARLAAAADQFGPESILPYSYAGTMGLLQSESLDRRFFHGLGASLLDRTICATAGVAGYTYTVGSVDGMDPDAFADSRLIINWGSNTAVTNVHLWVRMHEARKQGARIITIDPFRSRTAERSDWHLAIRPGTDAALALGVMHVLFDRNLADQDYLERYCVGADELRERAAEFDPERVARLTGVSSRDVIRLAELYASERPAAIRVNYGLQRHRGGGMAVRTVACLPAVAGHWRDRAGGILLSTSRQFGMNKQRLQRPDLIPTGTRTINMVQLAEALEGTLPGPPVKVLFVYNSNPAAVAPDLNRVLNGLRRDDLFVVVMEQFPTDTVDYADVVLPATMQFEHFDLHTSYGHQWVQWNEPLVPALGEARSNTDVFRELMMRCGFDSDLYASDDRHLAREALWELDETQPETLKGITVDRLAAEGPLKLNLPGREAPFAEGRFPTDSGRCELYSERMLQDGFDPLPQYTPPAEVADADSGGLALLSPPSPHFLNSTFVNVPSLQANEGKPTLEISRADAESRGIDDGDRVRIFNARGAFEAEARLSERVGSGTVVAQGIWWLKFTDGVGNANLTTPTLLTDMGGGATFFDNRVEVEKVAA